jgi:hypothetical protein
MSVSLWLLLLLLPLGSMLTDMLPSLMLHLKN